MKSEGRGLVAFSLLYFAQGSLMSYFFNFQKNYLFGQGVPAAQIGALGSLLFFAFILKVFWAFLADRVAYRIPRFRLSIIRWGIGVAALGFFAISFVSPAEHFVLFAALLFLATSATAAYDASADGIAVLNFNSDTYSRAQTAMIAGRSGGFIVSSLIMGWLSSRVGFEFNFFALAVFALLPLPFLRFLSDNVASRVEDHVYNYRSYSYLGEKQTLFFVGYVLFYCAMAFTGDGLMTFYLGKILAFRSSDIGQYGSMRGVGALLGAGLCSLLLKKFPLKVITPPVVALLSILCAWASVFLNQESYLSFAFVWGLVLACCEICFLSLCMGMSRKNLAATSFAIFMILGNFAGAAGDYFATAQTDARDFYRVFLGLSYLALPALLCFLFWHRSSEKALLRAAKSTP